MRFRLSVGLLLAVAAVAAPVDYVRDIAPLLAAQCGTCHSAETNASGFSVASLATVMAGGKKHGKAVIGGHPDRSPLVRMVRGSLSPRMPLGRELNETDIERLEAWIRQLPAEHAPEAAAWRWPFEKPVKPSIPHVRGPGWVRNPMDAFILAKLEAAGLRPAPAASRRALMRRNTLGPRAFRIRGVPARSNPPAVSKRHGGGAEWTHAICARFGAGKDLPGNSYLLGGSLPDDKPVSVPLRAVVIPLGHAIAGGL